METSTSIVKISKALLDAQKEMVNAIKDSNNPFFKSKYADLNSVREACMPALNKHGITLIQPTVFKDGKNFINTILLHESGEFISGLTEIVYSKQNDAQSQGSGVTYARRYGMQSMCNIGVEDDDGNNASNPQTSTTGGTENKEDKPALPWLNKSDAPNFANVVKAMRDGYKIADVRKKWSVSKATEKELEEEVNKPA